MHTQGPSEHSRPGKNRNRYAVLYEPRDLSGEEVQPQVRYVELGVSDAEADADVDADVDGEIY